MRKTLCAVGLAAFAFCYASFAQQPVLQRGYDPGLSGANLTETALTPSTVTPTTFGLLYTLPVDDRIYAQPLYVPQVDMGGQGIHNVVYVATMSDTLYAFDADLGGAPLWSVNFASTIIYSSVQLLATGVNGNQANQTFVVTYTDGTTTSITQSLSDWYTPQGYAGESIVSTMPYRVTANGTTDNQTFNLYGYSLAINNAKTVQSLTLPNNRKVVALSVDLVP